MKIVYTTPWFPYPPVNGSKIRIFHLLKHLAAKHEVHLISFRRNGEIIDQKALETICASIQTVPWRAFSPLRPKAVLGFFSAKPRSIVDTYHKEMDARLKETVDRVNPNLIIASELATAPYALSFRSINKILDEVQVKVLYDSWKNSENSIVKLRKGLTWLKTSRYLSNLMVSYDACTTASIDEKVILSQLVLPNPNLHIIPNGVDLDTYQPGIAPAQSDTLIYPGALTYTSNFDAMHFFLKEIFPEILTRLPSTQLTITGNTQGVDLNKLDINENVTLTGFLHDIRLSVASSWACVVPLRVGGGTRLKILEAMALGTPVVSTSKGAEGLDVTHEENILIADSPQSFASQTIRVLNDPNLRSYLSSQGRKLVESLYGWQSIGNQFLQLVESVAGSND